MTVTGLLADAVGGGWGLAGLSGAELDLIHGATLDVLERSGVVVESDAALDILDEGGCVVDRAARRVVMPRAVVEAAIRSAPERVLMAARDPERDVVLEPGHVGFTVFGVGLRVLDLDTGDLRPSTLDDLAQATRLCDALDSVDIAFQAVDASDLPEDFAKGLIEAETLFAN
ncbi:MAG: trimethylamine methyltransferase family protein, partial [Actinobacteria bacterium]|nr:trimethylamine methyltransferase family protein [Actinomycetota bacterium]